MPLGVRPSKALASPEEPRHQMTCQLFCIFCPAPGTFFLQYRMYLEFVACSSTKKVASFSMGTTTLVLIFSFYLLVYFSLSHKVGLKSALGGHNFTLMSIRNFFKQLQRKKRQISRSSGLASVFGGQKTF